MKSTLITGTLVTFAGQLTGRTGFNTDEIIIKTLDGANILIALTSSGMLKITHSDRLQIVPISESQIKIGGV